MHFVDFLIERGVVTRAQVLHATAIQSRGPINLRTLVVSEGYMTADDVTAVVRAQRRRREPKSFAALAVEFGYLTEADVARLAEMVKQQQVSLPDLLIRLGMTTRAELDDYWRLYDRSVRRRVTSGEVVSRLKTEQEDDGGEQGGGLAG